MSVDAAPVPPARRRFWPLALLLPVGLLFAVNLGGYPRYGNDDEGTYVAQARAVLEHGSLAHYGYWYDHPPLGWLQLAAVLRPAQWLTGGAPAVLAGRAVMVLAAVAVAALLYRMARNLELPQGFALGAVLLWALSPLTLAYGRQVLLDNLALVWVLAALVLATGRPARRPLLVGVCLGLAILTKETSLLAAPGILLAGGRGELRRGLAAAALVVAAWPLYALLRGELFLQLAIAGWQLHARPGSGWLPLPGSDANRIAAGWLELDPVLLPVGLVAVAFALAARRTRAVALVPAVLVLAALRPGGYLPGMYVIMLLPFLALFVVDLARRIPLPRIGFALPVLLLAVVWAPAVRTALTADENEPYRDALAYVAAELPRDTVVLTDDVSWTDLVRLGWNDDGWHGPLWHFKLDRDPEAREQLPGGWREVDYLLAGPPMTALLGTPSISPEQSPQVLEAWRHSTVVRAWGPPGARTELRRVTP